MLGVRFRDTRVSVRVSLGLKLVILGLSLGVRVRWLVLGLQLELGFRFGDTRVWVRVSLKVNVRDTRFSGYV